MATSSTYCTHRDLKDIYPNIDAFDTKTPIYGWVSLGNNVYIAHNVGLVTQLYVDGKELNAQFQVAENVAAFYKTSVTASLDPTPDNDSSTFNIINYNAGAFTTGSEADIQVGDYIELDDNTDGNFFEYAFVEAVNTGVNQITVRRAALGTTSSSWTTGNASTIEDYIRVTKENQWYYDSYYDQVILYSATNPIDLLVEAGEDYSTLITRITKNASRYFDSRVDAP